MWLFLIKHTHTHTCKLLTSYLLLLLLLLLFCYCCRTAPAIQTICSIFYISNFSFRWIYSFIQLDSLINENGSKPLWLSGIYKIDSLWLHFTIISNREWWHANKLLLLLLFFLPTLNWNILISPSPICTRKIHPTNNRKKKKLIDDASNYIDCIGPRNGKKVFNNNRFYALVFRRKICMV